VQTKQALTQLDCCESLRRAELKILNETPHNSKFPPMTGRSIIRYWVVVLCSISVMVTSVSIFGITDVHALSCSGDLFESIAAEEPRTQFSPYDTIYLRVLCQDLTEGSHTTQVDWIHSRLGLMRTDERIMDTSNQQDLMFYFWLKLHKRGPLSAMLSGSDFKEQLLGEWEVRCYVDDVSALIIVFSVSNLTGIIVMWIRFRADYCFFRIEPRLAKVLK
jgi:hypothetical protein